MTSAFTRRYGYNADGRLLMVTHPSGLRVRHGYNAKGYWHQLLNDTDSTEAVALLNRDA